MAAQPVVAQKSPYAIEVKAGKVYSWYSCGRSSRQPFCDGSFKDSRLEPVAWTAEKSDTAYFCGCE